jgi:hypothetical protein
MTAISLGMCRSLAPVALYESIFIVGDPTYALASKKTQSMSSPSRACGLSWAGGGAVWYQFWTEGKNIVYIPLEAFDLVCLITEVLVGVAEPSVPVEASEWYELLSSVVVEFNWSDMGSPDDELDDSEPGSSLVWVVADVQKLVFSTQSQRWCSTYPEFLVIPGCPVLKPVK